jgi:hypothetical protein
MNSRFAFGGKIIARKYFHLQRFSIALTHVTHCQLHI